jgi:hypothetical protein
VHKPTVFDPAAPAPVRAAPVPAGKA